MALVVLGAVPAATGVSLGAVGVAGRLSVVIQFLPVLGAFCVSYLFPLVLPVPDFYRGYGKVHVGIGFLGLMCSCGFLLGGEDGHRLVLGHGLALVLCHSRLNERAARQGSRKSKIGWELTKSGCYKRSPEV